MQLAQDLLIYWYWYHNWSSFFIPVCTCTITSNEFLKIKKKSNTACHGSIWLWPMQYWLVFYTIWISIMNQIHSVLKTYFLSYSYLGLNIKVYEMTTSASHIWKGGGHKIAQRRQFLSFIISPMCLSTCTINSLNISQNLLQHTLQMVVYMSSFCFTTFGE